LFAARSNKCRVGQDDFEKAMDKIVMGTERRSMRMSEQDRKLTAYHEAGHAIVGLNVPDHDPVYKVSIIPRGRALGVTVYLPDADRYSHTREFLNSRICSLFGGRLAEEIVFGPDKVTTGASNDIQCATDIARSMVTQYGMSDRLGPLLYSGGNDQSFLEGNAAQIRHVSNDTACAIDQAVREIIERNYLRARRILEANLDPLHRMAAALIEYETIDREQIQAIMQGRDAGPPASQEIPARAARANSRNSVEIREASRCSGMYSMY
jgi:cell division protease FtsH